MSAFRRPVEERYEALKAYVSHAVIAQEKPDRIISVWFKSLVSPESDEVFKNCKIQCRNSSSFV